MIHVVGNLNLDIVLGPLERWPAPGTEVVLPYQTVRIGGAAGNAIKALRALGVPTRGHTTVGNDHFGDMLSKELGQDAVDAVRHNKNTAYTVGISHPNGERTFFTYLGHLEEYDPAPVFDALAADPGGYLLLCGYFLLPGLRNAGALELIEAARHHGHTVVFDSGWPTEGWSTAVRDELDSLLPLVDIVLPNEVEAYGWAQTQDVVAAIRHLERFGGRAVVKLGARGAGWLRSETLELAPPAQLRVVDTIGAGDAFNAGLIAARLHGLGLDMATAVAVEVAGQAISSNPRSYPSWDEAVARLALAD